MITFTAATNCLPKGVGEMIGRTGGEALIVMITFTTAPNCLPKGVGEMIGRTGGTVLIIVTIATNGFRVTCMMGIMKSIVILQ
jgi:hypothetical protein